MRTFRLVVATMAVITIGVVPALAQEPGNVGLTMTSASTVGLTIGAGERVAIRPEVGFARTTIEDGIGGDRSTTSWTPGISLLFYVKSWDSTRLYLAPRWTYSRATNTVDEATSSSHLIAGMIGAQHNITNRFAAFGEVGIGRTSSKSDSPFAVAKSHSWSTRSTVGAILFF